nr:replication protein A 70 kDa DNA-binding subunit A-like [Ipomoea batatas]
MPPPVKLSEGAISMLINGEGQAADMKPVLQVADIRLVNTQNQSSTNERYRIMLSDGEFLQQGMLATQRNDLVRSQQIQKGSIIQLNQFVCNVIQNRMIIIIIELDVILDVCDPIGDPKQHPPKTNGNTPVTPPVTRSSAPVQSYVSQSGSVTGNPQSFTSGGGATGFDSKPNVPGGIPSQPFETNRQVGHGSAVSNVNLPRYNSPSAPVYPKVESGSGASGLSTNSYLRPPQPSYQHPSPVFSNRGPIARNEAPPCIIPIAALNPYQNRWTIKARVTAKGELRHYNNARGDGKVFSFDLLDSDGGEIRVTCFNAVADQFYNQIEPNKVYLISKGNVRVLQDRAKAFNNLRNDHEIHLELTSTVQPCLEDDKSIPQQQFQFRSISEIEEMDNNTIIDVIGIVSSISPSSSIMRKNGTETLKRSLQLKDMSGRSVELTLWGNFCNAEGQTLQNMCDSGVFPVLAVKACRINDFNGKAIGTISPSQMFIEPDFPEAHKLREWFDKDGKNAPVISISRETSMGRTDVRKTISQIKDEKLGTSEKPDWITISATLSYIKPENFCYNACPNMIGERQCNKKVTNDATGKWLCERCDKTFDECDYRYILQFQIQDHTGLTWVTAFQECGEEIMGMSAKDLHYMKNEEQDDERFQEVMRNVLFKKYIFKLKVKEEMFSDEVRVKSTAVKVEKVNPQSETKYILDMIDKLKAEELNSVAPNANNVAPSSGLNNTAFGSGIRESGSNVMNYGSSAGTIGSRVQTSQAGPYGNQYGGSGQAPPSSHMYTSCTSCGGTGHNSVNCPNVTRNQGQAYGGGGFNSRVGSGPSAGAGASNVPPAYGSNGASDKCYKCGETGHWSRDCPGASNVPPAYGSNSASGKCYKCGEAGHWSRDCPGASNAPPAYGSNTMNPGRFGNVPSQHVGGF